MEFTKKRRDVEGSGEGRKKGEASGASVAMETMETEGGETLVFEDPFGDEYEVEEYDENDEEDGDDEGEEAALQRAAAGADAEGEMGEKDGKKVVWRPGVDQIDEGEELDYDPSAYVMYHCLRTEWPCLTFDVLRDDLGDNRLRFPMTMHIACGSQADRADKNKITILKLSELHKTQTNDASDEESDDENLDEDPVLEHLNIAHAGGVNRLRCMPQQPGVIATMAETRQMHIFDAATAFRSLLVQGPREQPQQRPAYSFRGHRDEGFALDWSPVIAGRLASGDCAGSIHITNSTTGGTWQTDTSAYRGHTGSVEDIQWSPTEGTVFVSCSADKTVRIWDTRGRSGPQISVKDAHTADVNVISWNRSVGYLLASGSDDGSFKVWDLRSINQRQEPLAHFKYHTDAITSIEWAPHDESVLCASSADDQVTVWDLSVEADESATAGATAPEFPPQLLFIHQGQHNVKEIHHHPQIPGVILSTAEDGFNVFKPAISAN